MERERYTGGMAVTAKLMTAEEFLTYPDREDGRPTELLDGEVIVMAPVGDVHGGSAGDTYSYLRDFARRNDLGIVRVETGYVLRRDPDRVVAPDVSFTAHERLDPNRDREKYIEGAPTLAVEVVSPSDRDRDVGVKVLEYLAAGTERVWVVRPQSHTVTVHRPDGTARTLGPDDRLTSDEAAFAVPGFMLPVRDLFQ